MAVTGSVLARSWTLLGPSSASFDLCAFFFSNSCDRELANSRWFVLGVPIWGWALGLFALVAGLLLLARAFEESFAQEALLAAECSSLAVC
jgi:hypothetical protein